ncbi:25681_t:CDS:2 [Racocetra persica]|uniref:25681_t:CDS:1 n=1 Tax=Racocetra persica TaxID=160502 RepID=A0ACA9M5T4_9GLOM|nr:25681_t:CDS:2 [Racocetra persica]
MTRLQVSFCLTIGEELTELENICGVKTYSAEQAKYNSFIQRRNNRIEKQLYITQQSNIQGSAFVQFNTGFFWFITVSDINESLRYLKYISDTDETSRYNLGAAFAPSRKDGHLRRPYNQNPTLIPPPEDDNNRQLPTTTINTPTTTINIPTTTINTLSTTSINTPTITINILPSRPTNFPKILTTETTSKLTTSATTTIKPSSVKPTPITTTLSTPTINFISYPICKNEFKENKIELYLKEHIKNPLLKDTVHDKLGMKKQSIVFDKIKELVSKLTDIQVKELIDKIQKLIEKYREKFIDYIPDEIKEQILYNFDKIMIGIIELQDEIEELKSQLLAYQNSNYIQLQIENKDLSLTNKQLLIEIKNLKENNATTSIAISKYKLQTEIKKLSTLINYFSLFKNELEKFLSTKKTDKLYI